MDTYTRYALVDTPIGVGTLVASGDALIGVSFSRPQSETDEAGCGNAVSVESDDVLLAAEYQLVEFLNGARTTFDLRTESHGDAFQERIWSLINEIPFGQTTTLDNLAKKYASRYLVRDVGHAVDGNPLAVIVPSHRVIGQAGNIGGYAAGLKRKRVLLEIEGNCWMVRGQRSDLRYLTLRRARDEAAVRRPAGRL